MKYGCIGEHLSHSFSKEIHSKLADYEYEICEVPQTKLDSFFAEKNFLGINVTIPYKEKVIPYLDFVSESAKKIGAVNTIINQNGKLSGFNTDFDGMVALFKKSGINPDKKNAIIIGTGGTSKTAKCVLEYLGAEKITFVSRSEKPGAVSREFAETNLLDTQIIVNATPCGMYPEPENLPVDIDKFPNLCGIIDAIYNPLRTRLILKAMEKGIKAECGLFMLVEQARVASEIFLGTKYDKSVSDSVFSSVYSEKENIVLTGMPSSGKSTIGKKLAKKLGLNFFDTDDLIEKKAGKSIKNIFAEMGEESFRNLESEVIYEVSKTSGAVIATGGGAVLRKENVLNLKSNGRIFLINRPIENLTATNSRPLFSSQDKVKKLYEERKEIYQNTSDVKIDTENSIDKAIKDIIKETKK